MTSLVECGVKQKVKLLGNPFAAQRDYEKLQQKIEQKFRHSAIKKRNILVTDAKQESGNLESL